MNESEQEQDCSSNRARAFSRKRFAKKSPTSESGCASPTGSITKQSAGNTSPTGLAVSECKGIEIGSMLKGHLKFAILKALEKKPLHGYAIINAIADLTTVWKPTTGSIYPMLSHMEKEKLVIMKTVKEKKRKKKDYSITKKGLKELKAQQKMIEPMIGSLKKMFQKFLPKENIEADHLLELVSKAGFLKKELLKSQQNILGFLILHAKGKTTKSCEEKVKRKLAELNSLLSRTLREKH